ncbi:MAG: sialate O-acetylesterase [Cyanobacteria bacterium SZAS LIN-2]|nr:sialate O-acetylesterase [Cyanobacteria bacterium SZAS LIN-2]
MKIKSLNNLSLALSGLLATVCSAPALADVKLPAIESDYMVLQAGNGTKFFGTAAPGEAVTVSYGGRQAAAVADKNGHWETVLKALKAGERFDIEVVGKNTINIKNVLVGQVWLCSGQSNMEWPLSQAKDAAQELAAANHEQIRLFNVKRKLSTEPLSDVEGNWLICNTQTAAPFSAVAYFFGRDLQKDLRTPVGLIESAWGGTPAQAWTSLDGLEADPVTQKRYWMLANEQLAHLQESAQKYERSLAEWKAAPPPGSAPPAKPMELEFPNAPSMLFNGMISGLLPATIGGVLWYQGESNATAPEETMAYRRLLPALIKDWRNKFQNPNLPFLFVQLANYEKKEEPNERSPWAELREAQLLTLSVPRTGMAVAVDIGESKDIHPRNKQDVGKRLERIALAHVYGRDVPFSGPVFTGMRVKGSKAVCSFRYTNRGLTTRSFAKLQGFLICGPDKKFVPADAVIVGNTVEVTSPGVTQPVAVRYGWQGDPVCNLYNGAGFPASPFRSDVAEEPPVVNLPVTK